MAATLRAARRRLVTRCVRLFHILTNTAPSAMPAAESQDFSASIGQAISPRGTATRRPMPSWSVFERRSMISIPSGVSSMSSALSATSSERRNAPAKPSSRMARSRSSRSDRPLPPTMPSTMSEVAAFLRTGAAPIVLRIPDSTALTFSSPVGVS
jgi:hypothetical protein